MTLRPRAHAAALAAALTLAGCGVDDRDPAAPFAQLRLGAVLGETDTAGFERAEGPRAFQFPRDHGPHERFRSEWWYLTLMLEGSDGREFGGQFTIFRQALAPAPVNDNPWQTNQVFLGHLAVTDVAAGEHHEAERISRGHPALAGAKADPFRVWLEGWTLEAVTPEQWRLSAAAEGMELALELEQAKPVVLQGEAGLSRKGPGQASYYFSIPRLSVRGTLSLRGAHHTVSGSAWFDREWSTSVLGADQQGWDWFALQLDDGTDFMGFQLRRRDGARDPFDHGVRVDADGEARQLAAADFELDALRFWRDDHGVRWPVEWQITCGDDRWRLRAAIDDQRMDVSITYWEGLVHVYDGAGARVGRGYMELTGYADE